MFIHRYLVLTQRMYLGILTDRSGERFGKDGANNPDIRLSPESIAEACHLPPVVYSERYLTI